MGERRRRIDKVLDPECLADLPDWPLDELRRRQAECLEIETEVSYVRRMTQARIDILEAEIDRRATPAAPGHRPRGGRPDRPAQGGPGVISARE